MNAAMHASSWYSLTDLIDRMVGGSAALSFRIQARGCILLMYNIEVTIGIIAKFWYKVNQALKYSY